LLLFMINDILDFSQITNGRLSLSPQNFNLNEMLLDVTNLIKFQAKRKGLEFIIENRFRDKKRCMIRSDPNRIKQIILNLLGNALKFTQKGFIKIIYEPVEDNIACDRRIGDAVRFSVQDTGLGIRKEDQRHLFELFGKLQNEDSKKVNQTGVGLGLAISQNLVKILNNHAPDGIITVESEYGVGSTFSFLIYPFTNDSQESPRSFNIDTIIFNEAWDIVEEDEVAIEPVINNSISAYNIIGQTKRIQRLLLVDDDQINMMVITRFVSSFQDCVYDIAYNGLDALEKVKNNAQKGIFYDIIFMDCNMPVMDGFESTINIIKLVEKNAIPKLSIIATTANASPLDHENCFNSGMIDFIAKPYKKSHIRSKIDLYKKNK
jgi:CheY-like chemotaxis protein